MSGGLLKLIADLTNTGRRQITLETIETLRVIVHVFDHLVRLLTARFADKQGHIEEFLCGLNQSIQGLDEQEVVLLGELFFRDSEF